MAKRKHRDDDIDIDNDDNDDDGVKDEEKEEDLGFRVTASHEATSLRDGVELSEGVVLPWVGFGTYRLGQNKAFRPVLNALEAGYRCIDTAFVYARETTELEVGKAIQLFLSTTTNRKNNKPHTVKREDLFVITKHWRSYHGYDATLKCLEKSLSRLRLDYVDLYLIHWPGPTYDGAKRRQKQQESANGGGGGDISPWSYTTVSEGDMASTRAETWRAMEDALERGLVRSIGVSNFTVAHLETLQKTARVWPPAVNQVECHPLYPQDELCAYCAQEGIVLQAYAALGGQDGTKAQWKQLPSSGKLLDCEVVQEVADQLQVTPAQVLLRYALQRNCAVTPKTASTERLQENANVFGFTLQPDHMKALDELRAPGETGRLCWRNDPLRLLDFP